MSRADQSLPKGKLPVFAVFAESLVLAARNSTRLLIWSLPIEGTGLLAVAVAAWLPLTPLVALGLQGTLAACLVMLACAFSVRVHRWLLLQGEPLSGYAGQLFEPSTRRYFAGVSIVAAMALVPVAFGLLAASAVPALGLDHPVNALANLLLPYFSAQAAIAGPQLVFLTNLSLKQRGAWNTSTAMMRGFGWRLTGINLLSALFNLGVTLFAGWLVGMAFEDGPLGLLELFTIVLGLPAQIGCFACLQAVCYKRLAADPAP